MSRIKRVDKEEFIRMLSNLLMLADIECTGVYYSPELDMLKIAINDKIQLINIEADSHYAIIIDVVKQLKV